METEELIDALFDVLEPGDLIRFEGSGQTFKVIDLLPSHLMWEDEDGETSLISWRDFISMREWGEEDQPRFTKYYDTEEYKKRSEETEAMLAEMWEEIQRDPHAFNIKYGIKEDEEDDHPD